MAPMSSYFIEWLFISDHFWGFWTCSSVLRSLKLHAALQIESHENRGPESPRPAGLLAFDAIQDMICFLGCKNALQDQVQPLTHQHPQNLFSICLTTCIDIEPSPNSGATHCFAKHHEVPIGPLLKLVQVPQIASHPLATLTATLQYDVQKFSESELNPAVHVIDEDIKHFSSQ